MKTIKENELRVGNITQYGNILALPFEDGRVKAMIEIGVCEIDQLERIEITSQLLDQIVDCEKIKSRIFYNREVFEYRIFLENYNGQYLTITNTNHLIAVFKGEGNNDRIIILSFISGLHELQNLYFALTGKELQFKLK
jgi:hypothetical protein